jgi:hypothetical protein
MPKGEQMHILTPGRNEKTNVFITMLWPSRKVLYNTCRRRRSRGFKEYLKSLLRNMREQGFKEPILVVDNATVHRSRETRFFPRKA